MSRELAIIPTGNEAVVFFAEALGKLRALDNTESMVLHRAIIRDTGAFRRWTSDDDARLLKMHKAKIRGADMALQLNRSEDAVRRRLCDLKKAARVER